MNTNGWIGSVDELKYVLQLAGATRSEQGYHVRGLISLYMGVGPDCVAGEDAQAEIGGRWVPIVPLLHQTSYGRKVTVI
jgi:hypothetical protein